MFQTTNQIWIVKRIITATEISLTISHSISGYTSPKKKSPSAMVTWMCILLRNWVKKNSYIDENRISPILDGMKYWLDSWTVYTTDPIRGAHTSKYCMMLVKQQ